MNLPERVRSLGRALGFDRVGFAAAEPGPHAEFLREWLGRGYAGEMRWLEQRIDEREDPARYLPGARSVIAVALVYDAGDPVEAEAPAPGRARVARYARGVDYHELMGDRLRAYRAGLEALVGHPVAAKASVDTAPVLERGLAAAAGLGWIGRNTLLIDPELGSHLFLGTLVTDLALPPDAPLADHCGTCRACLDACPTDAFPEDYVLDATRCLSYATIEQRGPTAPGLAAAQGAWVFGCDVCADVCPWNQRSRRSPPADPLGLRAQLAARPAWREPTLAWVLGLDEDAWRDVTRHSALRRARHRALLRNALHAAANVDPRADPSEELVAALRRHAAADDAELARLARDALARLSGGPS